MVLNQKKSIAAKYKEFEEAVGFYKDKYKNKIQNQRDQAKNDLIDINSQLKALTGQAKEYMLGRKNEILKNLRNLTEMNTFFDIFSSDTFQNLGSWSRNAVLRKHPKYKPKEKYKEVTEQTGIDVNDPEYNKHLPLIEKGKQLYTKINNSEENAELKHESNITESESNEPLSLREKDKDTYAEVYKPEENNELQTRPNLTKSDNIEPNLLQEEELNYTEVDTPTEKSVFNLNYEREGFKTPATEADDSDFQFNEETKGVCIYEEKEEDVSYSEQDSFKTALSEEQEHIYGETNWFFVEVLLRTNKRYDHIKKINN